MVAHLHDTSAHLHGASAAPSTATEARPAPYPTSWSTVTQLCLLDWAPAAPAPPRAPTSITLPAPGPGPAQPPPAADVPASTPATPAEQERAACADRDRLARQLSDPQTPAPWRPRIQAAYDEACWRLVLPWLRLLERWAGRYADRAASAATRLRAQPYTADELYSEALEEAFKAARRFDPDRGFRFSTTLRLPVCARLRDLCRWRQSRAAALGPLRHLDDYRHDGDGTTALGHDLLSDPDAETPEEIVSSSIAADQAPHQLAALIEQAHLSPLARTVLALHHGLGQHEPMSFREIADELGISKSRACDVHGRAWKRLRALL